MEVGGGCDWGGGGSLHTPKRIRPRGIGPFWRFLMEWMWNTIFEDYD